MAGYIFSNSEAERVADTVRSNEGEVQRRLPPRPKKYVTVGGGGGGDCACSEVDEFYFYGSPSSGDADVVYDINGNPETLTFAYNSTAVQFKTELITHTEVTTDDCDVIGGPFPLVAISVIWKGDLANTSIQFPSIDGSNLTGTNVSLHMRKASAYNWSGY